MKDVLIRVFLYIVLAALLWVALAALARLVERASDEMFGSRPSQHIVEDRRTGYEQVTPSKDAL